MKRVYLVTQMELVDHGEPLGLVYRPYLGGLTHFDDDNTDYWDVIYSASHTNGVHEFAIVGVETSEANHAILEGTPGIWRIDDFVFTKNPEVNRVNNFLQQLGATGRVQIGDDYETAMSYMLEVVNPNVTPQDVVRLKGKTR